MLNEIPRNQQSSPEVPSCDDHHQQGCNENVVPARQKIVFEVVKRDKNHRRRKHKQRQQQEVTNDEEEHAPLPLEIRPVIDAILSYGRKTNALGELGVVKMLDDISRSLRSLHVDHTQPAVKHLIDRVEREAEQIRLRFENAYEQ